MSATLNGGSKTVINMGTFRGRWIFVIAVLHRECESSGKTNKLIFAWHDGFRVFAFLPPQHIIFLHSPRSLHRFLHLSLDAVDCLTFASFICGCSRLFNVCFIHICLFILPICLIYTDEMEKCIWLIL